MRTGFFGFLLIALTSVAHAAAEMPLAFEERHGSRFARSPGYSILLKPAAAAISLPTSTVTVRILRIFTARGANRFRQRAAA